jgi:hypothetical protein
VSEQLTAYLKKCRDDGNKIYTVMSLHFADPSLEALSSDASILERPGADLFAIVQIRIDPTKTVKPLAKTQIAVASSNLDKPNFKTLGKYTYFDSSDKYMKVQLSELAGLKDEKVEVEFFERSLTVKVWNFKGNNWSWAVPKLHAKICPPDCKWVIKSSCL